MAVVAAEDAGALRFLMAVNALRAAGVEGTGRRIYDEFSGGHGRWEDLTEHGKQRFYRLGLAALGFREQPIFQDASPYATTGNPTGD